MAFDILFIILLLLMAVSGYRSGFASQMIQLTGLIVGFLFAGNVAQFLVPFVGPYLTRLPEQLRFPILYLICFFLIWLLISMICSICLMWYRKRVFGENKPSGGDRFFGTGLAIVKWAFVVMVAVYVLALLPENVRENNLYKSQYTGSQVVGTADKVQVVGHIVHTREFGQLRSNLGHIYNYFTEKQEEAGDMKGPQAG